MICHLHNIVGVEVHVLNGLSHNLRVLHTYHVFNIRKNVKYKVYMYAHGLLAYHILRAQLKWLIFN